MLGTVELTDDKDLTPLLEADKTLGDSATLRFRLLVTNPKASLPSLYGTAVPKIMARKWPGHGVRILL